MREWLVSERLGRPVDIHLENPDARELIIVGNILIYLGKILALAGAEETRRVLGEISSKLKEGDEDENA